MQVVSTEKIIRDLKKRSAEPKTAIGTGLYLPNHSGDHSKGLVKATPVNDTDIVNKKYVDDNIVSYNQSLNTTDDVEFVDIRATGTAWADLSLRTNTIKTQSNAVDLSLNTLTTGDFTFNNSVNGNVATIDDSGNASFDGTLSIGGHLINFLDLADTPANYTAAGSKFVKVNAAATGIEFVAPAISTKGYMTFVPTAGSNTVATQNDKLTWLSTNGSIKITGTEGGFEADTMDVEFDLTNDNAWSGAQTFSAPLEKTSGTITPVRLVNGNATTTEDDELLIILSNAAARTVNLHDVSALGTTRSMTLFIIRNGTNNVTIDPYSTKTIDGASTKVLGTNLDGVRIQCYNGDWYTVGTNN